MLDSEDYEVAIIKKKLFIIIIFFFLIPPVLAQDTAVSSDSTASPSGATVTNSKPSDSKKEETKKPVSEMDKLKQEIQRLEEKINKMSEENDIRRRLETTAEEKSSTDEAILSAAGRDYTLMKPGNLGFELNVSYTGDAYDGITSDSSGISAVNHNAYHTLSTGFYIEFPVKDNMTVTSNIPFVYKYSSQSNSKTAKDVSDIGDVSFGCQLQPIKSGGDFPALILSSSLTCPTGRSPYKIDTTREMSTGNGGYSVSLGCNLSKSVDPVVAFGGVQYGHGFDINKLNFKSGTQGEAGIYLKGVRPGDVYSFSMGIGYSLSYKVNLTMGYQYSYQAKTHYDWVGQNDTKSEGAISSELSIGTGWTITPKRSMNVKVGIGLTSNDPAFSISVRVPFNYEL
jgi:cell division protein FtsB